MTETLIREHIEIERKRDERSSLETISAIKTALAILQTKFEGALERAVQGNDLKELKREMEAEMNKQIGHICQHFDNQTAQQSKDILGRVEGMFNAYQAQTTNAQLEHSQALLKAQSDTRKEILRYGIGFALTVLSALVIIWLTGRSD